MDFKIEKMEIPAYGGKHPFAKMEVGDGFAVSKEQLSSIRSAAWVWGSRHGKKFTGRKTETGGVIIRVE